MPDHTASGVDEANVSKTSNMMAIPDEHSLHPTDRDWDTAKVYEHLESAVAGAGDRLVMGPTSEDVLFLTDFLARQFNQMTELSRAMDRGDAQADEAIAFHKECNKIDAKHLLSILADEKAFYESTLYRVTTILLILAVYGDGHEYPADEQFAQSCAVRICQCTQALRANEVPAESKGAVDILCNASQNIAWSCITQTQLRIFCRLTGLLMYNDHVDPEGEVEPFVDFGAIMRRHQEQHPELGPIQK